MPVPTMRTSQSVPSRVSMADVFRGDVRAEKVLVESSSEND
jgi:hypothetical protein